MILFAHPSSLVQAGFARLLAAAGECAVEEVYTGAQALERLAHRHTLLACGWRLPDMFAVDLMQRLKDFGAPVPVMVVSRSSHAEDAAAALRAGCQSYLWEGSDAAELQQALANRARGMAYVTRALDTALLRQLLERPKAHLPLELLSRRQRQVLGMLADGLSVLDIAQRLNLSHKTVETHRAMIRERIGCTTLAAMTVFAVTHGLTERAQS